MNKTIKRYYARFRSLGYHAERAIYAARTLEAFENLDGAEITAEPEQDRYFDVYGEPNNPKEYRTICDALDRLGCWAVDSRIDGEIVDSIGMCVYENPTSPYENDYVIDLMAAAIEYAKGNSIVMRPPENLIPAWVIQCREHGDEEDSLFLLSKVDYPHSQSAFDAIKRSFGCDGNPDRFYCTYCGSVWVEPEQAHTL